MAAFLSFCLIFSESFFTGGPATACWKCINVQCNFCNKILTREPFYLSLFRAPIVQNLLHTNRKWPTAIHLHRMSTVAVELFACPLSGIWIKDNLPRWMWMVVIVWFTLDGLVKVSAARSQKLNWLISFFFEFVASGGRPDAGGDAVTCCGASSSSASVISLQNMKMIRFKQRNKQNQTTNCMRLLLLLFRWKTSVLLCVESIFSFELIIVWFALLCTGCGVFYEYQRSKTKINDKIFSLTQKKNV